MSSLNNEPKLYDKDLDAHVHMAEASECDLEKATGGKVRHSDMQVQKYLDKASIILF